MSGLWTPSGDFDPQSQPAPAETADEAVPGMGPGDEALLQEEMARFQAQLAATPAIEVIANHAVGLFELARLQLALAAEGPESVDERRHRVEEARLCCDAFAGVVENVGDRLGEAQGPLNEGLAQLRLAIVQVGEAIEGSDQA